MKSLVRCAWLACLAAGPAAAATPPPAADYVCAYGCRATDANPRLEIEGEVARCWNELGGLYVGQFTPPDRIACFRKIGRILDGGARIEWSDGVVWRRPRAWPESSEAPRPAPLSRAEAKLPSRRREALREGRARERVGLPKPTSPTPSTAPPRAFPIEAASPPLQPGVDRGGQIFQA